MVGFRRVFQQNPGDTVLTAIEGANIIDVTPPSPILGAGEGTVLLVGEFERGVFAPQEVFGGTQDLEAKFGLFGFATPSSPHDGPVARKSGGDENWNGNGFVWLRSKQFSRLIIQRVDNSAGSVSFSRLACLTAGEATYNTEPGRTITFQRDGVTNVVATILANAALLSGSGFAPEASIVWQFDDGTTAFVDQTTGFNDATDANCTPFPATATTDDAFYVGRESGTFSNITFDYLNGTAGIGGTVAWEYWDGTAWTAVSGLTDATAGFTTAVADGLVVSWTVPTDWAVTSVNGRSAYYIRARVTGGYSTDPVLDQGFVETTTNVTGFVGGEYVDIKDGEDATRRVTFTAADQTPTQGVARINAVLAKTIAVVNGTQVDLQSSIRGSSGRIEVVGADSAGTLAALGFVATPVQQVDTYTVTNAQVGTYTLRTQLYVAGVLTNFDATYVSVMGDTTTDIRDNLLSTFQGLGVPGVTYASGAGDTITVTGDNNVAFTSTVEVEVSGGDITVATTTGGLVSVDLGDGNVGNVDDIAAAEAVSVFDALAGLSASLDADGLPRVCNSGTPATGTLQVTAGDAVTDFGFDLTTISDAANGEDVTIPAGTRIQDSTSTATIWVTLQDIETGSGGGAFAAKVRPWQDDDTALASTAGDVTVILDTLDDGFSVTNAATLTRLSASQLDSRYQTAIDATLDDQSVARDANMIASARSSAAIMRALKANALQATADGLAARKYVVRPLIGTTRDTAKGTTGQGIAATGVARHERGFYTFPGVTTQIPEIAEVGAANGGVGFTDDGIIEVGFDSFYCQIRSRLPAEENAGKNLTETNVGAIAVLTLEDAYNSEKGGIALKRADYESFKANGIIAPRTDRSFGAFLQSDVTSVDPAVELSKADASRRFLADLIIDTLGNIGLRHCKKLAKPTNRQALINDTTSFLRGLKSTDQPQSSRILNFSVRDDSSDAQFELGIVFLVVNVKQHPHIKHPTFQVTVGTSVEIEEVA